MFVDCNDRPLTGTENISFITVWLSLNYINSPNGDAFMAKNIVINFSVSYDFNYYSQSWEN